MAYNLTIMTEISDGKVSFAVSTKSDVNYFFFYHENGAGLYSNGEMWVRALANHLPGPAFQVYFMQCTFHVELTKDAKDLEVVKATLKNKICKKKDMQYVIEAGAFMKLCSAR